MQLADHIQADLIKVPLKATEKQEAVYELVDLLAEHNLINDSNDVKNAVWQRESTRSTGIGHGLAIPHGKTAAAPRLAIAIGIPPQPIEYDSLDNRPVRLIFLLVSPPDQTGPHIQTLAHISRLMSNTSIREAAFEATDAKALLAIITQSDPSGVQ